MAAGGTLDLSAELSQKICSLRVEVGKLVRKMDYTGHDLIAINVVRLMKQER